MRPCASDLYGTTPFGGSYFGACHTDGCGVVFKSRPNGDYVLLLKFVGDRDGETPVGSLFLDSVGNLYGATANGGTAGTQRVPEFLLDGDAGIPSTPPSRGEISWRWP
jgi:hypothetical protein